MPKEDDLQVIFSSSVLGGMNFSGPCYDLGREIADYCEGRGRSDLYVQILNEHDAEHIELFFQKANVAPFGDEGILAKLPLAC